MLAALAAARRLDEQLGATAQLHVFEMRHEFIDLPNEDASP